MALTAAEKMRRRRQKLKDEGKYEEYKEKHRETAKKSRAEKKNELEHMTKTEREKVKRQQRKRSRESVAKSRLKKKEKKATIQSKQFPYKSPCSLGKAIARTKRALAKSPRKKQAVLKNLIENIVPSHERNSLLQNNRGKDRITMETVQMVQNFFERDDISRQAPRMKDVTIVKDSDGKHKKTN
ncbi:uncharacterized protein LOC129232768 [Uloborus diversus]|uniref:uncharacterized protein LOC129232768 n=1 Tax=Uloborus diversus TaxID=327109 RepID=UPI002409211D|nr:uncharacterized protein LOC129232768 [Uloborus diversus]